MKLKAKNKLLKLIILFLLAISQEKIRDAFQTIIELLFEMRLPK